MKAFGVRIQSCGVLVIWAPLSMLKRTKEGVAFWRCDSRPKKKQKIKITGPKKSKRGEHAASIKKAKRFLIKHLNNRM